MGIRNADAAQAYAGSSIATTPTESDLIVTRDASKTNIEEAISVRDLLAGVGAVRQVRKRFTTAEVNAGAELLPAVEGYKYRMVDAYAIAIGGNAATVTSVDILATLSTPRKLVSFLVAGLTRSTVLRAGAATNGVVLADGASFTANDANTGITVAKAGDDLATATHIDVCLTYVLDRE